MRFGVLTSVEFLQGDVKVMSQNPSWQAELTVPQRKAVVFQLTCHCQTLKPGFYTCQVNIMMT